MMGISTRVYTIFGWIVDSEPYLNYFEDIDYDTPEGVMLLGMDSTEVALGAIMFETNDLRWEPLEGYSSFTQDEAMEKLNSVVGNFDVFSNHIDGEEPKFYSFVDYS